MWITSFLRKTFFNPCSNHEQEKNEQNFYCINCDSVVCRHCIASHPHNQHKFLQIYKYSYRDAIRVKDMRKHFDSSQVQAYRCNGRKVNVLNPLPHVGTKTDKDDCCKFCQRKLIDGKHYSYCSIACKVQAKSGESNDQNLPNKVMQLRRSGASRRKGVPRRAPRD